VKRLQHCWHATMRLLAVITHWLAHLTGQNLGTIVSVLDKRDTVWIGFRCTGCGRVSGIHVAHDQVPKPSEFR
jgi:hypothetical protein